MSESQHLFEYDVQEEELREHFGSLINFVKTRAGLLLTRVDFVFAFKRKLNLRVQNAFRGY